MAAAVVLAGDAGGAFAAGYTGGEDYFLADAHCRDVGADLGDLTGDVTARNVGKRDRHSRDAAANPEVEVVQRAGLHAHKHVVRANGWIRTVGIFQNVRCAVLLENDSLQRTLSSLSR